MYGREELKVVDCQGCLFHEDHFFYVKSEADKVMDTLEAKLKELGEDYRKISEMYIAEQTKAAKYEQRIKELEAEVIGYKASLERVNFKACEKDARIKELEEANG